LGEHEVKLDIFDVGHGFCSVISCPDGKRLMIDCASKTNAPYWWPSMAFYGTSLAGLILTNLDEDHVRNFAKTIECLNVASVCINNTIGPEQLRLMKAEGDMGTGVQAVYEYLKTPNRLNMLMDIPQLTISMFRFPYGAYTDTNNLSLITFVQYGNFCVLFPGDLEEKAWKPALLNPAFRALLQQVNLFVTSHHGRESGCCAEMFTSGICNPDAFVISDKEMVHDTQETAAWYRQHAKGLHKILENPWDTPETRYVFTTRNDCCLTVNAELNGNFVLRRKSDSQKLVGPEPIAPKLVSILSPLLLPRIGSRS
jgi:beta-lactamase superfamily II metal-dependent hydrolase